MSRKTAYGVRRRVLPTGIVMLILLAVLYNTVLAMLNAAGLHQSFATVALTEVLILALGAGYIAGASVPIVNRLSINVIVFGLVLTLLVTIAGGIPAPDCGRASVIIGVFMIIGSMSTERQITLAFRLVSLLVLVVLVLELVDTPLYSKIFAPSLYYANTRGIEEFSLDNSGLFRNALGFQSRFSFGLSSHRTASVFLEQVSLANFAGVLCVYLLGCFDRLSLLDRVLHLLTAVLIILTNDSRTSSFLAVTSFLGYFVYPLLPAGLTFFIMPSVLTLGYAIFTILGPEAGDDFRGRITSTFLHLSELDVGTLFGFGDKPLLSFMDAGYPYVISGATIFGLLFLWFFVASALPADTAPRRRCLFGLNMFICSNLMIGGTAVFSIKVAAPLWALIGYMGYQARLVPGVRRAVERGAVAHTAVLAER